MHALSQSNTWAGKSRYLSEIKPYFTLEGQHLPFPWWRGSVQGLEAWTGEAIQLQVLVLTPPGSGV